MVNIDFAQVSETTQLVVLLEFHTVGDDETHVHHSSVVTVVGNATGLQLFEKAFTQLLDQFDADEGIVLFPMQDDRGQLSFNVEFLEEEFEEWLRNHCVRQEIVNVIY